MEAHTNLKNEKETNPESSFVAARGSFSEKKWNFINMDYLESIAPGNTDFFSELLLIFKSESVVFLKRMRKELLMKDFASLARTAHAMKPTGSYIGAHGLTLLIGNLEDVAKCESGDHAVVLVKEIEKQIDGVNDEIEVFLKMMNQAA